LKNQIDSLFDKPSYEILRFVTAWEESYSNAFKSNDEILLKELISISSKIDELNVILTQKREEEDKAHQVYLQSPEYKAQIEEYQKADDLYRKQEKEKYEKQEQERLQRCIEAYGEEKGRLFWQRL